VTATSERVDRAAFVLACNALEGAERVVTAEEEGLVTYVSGSTIRKLIPVERLARLFTIAIDRLMAERANLRVKITKHPAYAPWVTGVEQW